MAKAKQRKAKTCIYLRQYLFTYYDYLLPRINTIFQWTVAHLAAIKVTRAEISETAALQNQEI